MKMKHRKYKPYIRRASPKDKPLDFRVGCRMALFEERGKQYYVMVQHGIKNLVIKCGPSKGKVKGNLFLGGTFRKWQIGVKKIARYEAKK